MNEHLLEPFKPLTRSTKLKNKNKWCKYHGTSKPHCADGNFGQVIPFDKRDETTYKRCSGTCKYKETDWLSKKKTKVDLVTNISEQFLQCKTLTNEQWKLKKLN